MHKNILVGKNERQKVCLAHLHLSENIILNWKFYTRYKFVDNVQVIHYKSQKRFL